ncbi:helix-turn-helix domain-containing protein [Nocardiopsis changdeensis]|uniref:Helix-turn-helix transcriptional regulator n=1 Tax=Nocardiopsis changdeensis TaxID=2831969 RepID=A0ABX8BVX1_9ACTN|nr:MULTISPECIES: helix-turn-helix transcriptional regulator [Nocardiopsis]QUX24966.1 helix-turn-helix transcriptional regulator [Nocardiopsis changdeensis]QYX35352.1 helix-turn-helix transcriptional regulator [Nocardiopsis sp. MT53]
MTDYQTARASLGIRLRELREEAGLSGRELAARAEWHPSKVSRLERGNQTAAAADLRRWALLCGRQDAAGGLVAQLGSLETHYTGWRRRLAAGNRARQQNAVDLENRTRVLHAFESVCVPGLLQTQAYARAMIGRAVELYGTPADVEEGVRTRMERRAVLQDGEREVRILLWEPALYTRHASAQVQVEQLDHLASCIRRGLGGIGVIPLAATLPVSPMHGFWIYDEERVIVETVSAELYLTDDDAVRPYRRVFAALSRAAVSGHRALEPILRARAALTGTPA